MSTPLNWVEMAKDFKQEELPEIAQCAQNVLLNIERNLARR